MKKLALISSLVLLAACNQAAAPENDATQAAEPEAAAPVSYQLTFSDGTKGITVTTADGKYYHAAGNYQSGTMTLEEDGAKACFTAEGASEAVCTMIKDEGDGNYSGSAEDGSGTFTSSIIQ